ncbi:MAG: TolB family protein, partial [Cytophagaceae bacterium]
VAVFISLSSCYSQNIFTDLRSLEKRGDLHYSKLSYNQAADFYTLALKKKRKKYDYNLNIKAAALYKKLARYEEAKLCYQNLLAFGYALSDQDKINYFNVLRAVGDVKADTLFTRLYSREILNNLFRDTLYYNIYELPFNSDRSEYSPSFLENGLVYLAESEISSVVKTYNAINHGGFANMYYAAKTDTGWSDPVSAFVSLKNILHAGPVSFYDGNRKAIVNLCLEEGPEPYRLQLYSAEFDEESKQWANFSPLPFNSNFYSVSHPSISEDGSVIYFTSDMPGGKGGTDLYKSEFINGSWSDPVNMGNKINTPGDEKYPYITEDGILFFSSDGRYGIGGMDIYYTDLSFRDTIVVNMGYPVNSNLDDFAFSFEEKNKTGYFSSNRKSKGRDDDLYIYTENRIHLSVSLFDNFDKSALTDFTIELWDDELNIPLRHTVEQQPHIVKAWLRPAHRYRMVISKEDYKTDTLKISTYDMEDLHKSVLKTVHLKRKAIYFATLKLKNEAVYEDLRGSLIVVNNLTENKKDTLDHKYASEKIKLDANCKYIITLRKGENLRYIYVEKKPIKITASVPYYNLYLAAAKPSILHVKIRKCESANTQKAFDGEIVVSDWVNGNVFSISPGLDGDFKLVVTDARLFDLNINGTTILYSRDKVEVEGYCLYFME